MCLLSETDLVFVHRSSESIRIRLSLSYLCLLCKQVDRKGSMGTQHGVGFRALARKMGVEASVSLMGHRG